MARKLQSDKWLFLATLALVCVSVVMVYSASAVVALDRYQQPYYFVTRQVMWALLGLAVLSIVMRIDYRTYRNDQVVWARARRRRACCSSRCCSRGRSTARAAGSASAASASSRRSWPRWPPCSSPPSSSTGAWHRINDVKYVAGADRARHRRPGRADPARARLRHLGGAGDGRRRDGDRRRPALPLHPAALLALAVPLGYLRARLGAVPDAPLDRVLVTRVRPARRRLPAASSRSSPSAAAAGSAAA